MADVVGEVMQWQGTEKENSQAQKWHEFTICFESCWIMPCMEVVGGVDENSKMQWFTDTWSGKHFPHTDQSPMNAIQIFFGHIHQEPSFYCLLTIIAFQLNFSGCSEYPISHRLSHNDNSSSNKDWQMAKCFHWRWNLIMGPLVSYSLVQSQ